MVKALPLQPEDLHPLASPYSFPGLKAVTVQKVEILIDLLWRRTAL
jgi:hypothetical protein